MNVTHRINEFIAAKKLTIYAFELQIGAGKNVLQKSIKYNTGLHLKVLELIAYKYPELNMDWLIHGRGSMLFTGEWVSAALAPAAVSLTSGCDEWKYKYYSLLEKYNDCLESKLEMRAKEVKGGVI